MNPSKIISSCGTLLLLLLLQLTALAPVRAAAGEIRQRSDGCGRNPLITLAAAFGSGSMNLNDVLRMVKADPAVWSDMQDLLRRYDDCIRAGDGLHFKRSLPHRGIYLLGQSQQQQQQAPPALPLYPILQPMYDQKKK